MHAARKTPAKSRFERWITTKSFKTDPSRAFAGRSAMAAFVGCLQNGGQQITTFFRFGFISIRFRDETAARLASGPVSANFLPNKKPGGPFGPPGVDFGPPQ